jgi:alpha-galactosidase
MSKIVIIGAGSVVFSKKLIADIILTRELGGSTIALCDIDSENLEIISRLTRRLVIESEADIFIESSTEREAVLPGADYVIQTISIGGRAAWEKDLNIPMNYGIIQTVADKVGPGGISRALRVIPMVVDICHDIQEMCPGAILLNYSNPNSCICTAVHQYSDIQVVGLCSGLSETKAELAKYLGVPVSETRVMAAGINHFNWILKFIVQGQDGLEMLREMFNRTGIPDNMQISAKLFEIFGAYPVPNDRHVAEFLPYFLNPMADHGARYGLEPIKILHRAPEYWAEIRRHLEGEMPVDLYLKRSGEQAINIIAASLGDKDIIFDAVNIPSYGLVTNLPEGAVLEVPAIVGPLGIRGICLGDVPHGIAVMLSSRIYQQHLTVEAAMSGDRQLALQAMLLDPLVPSLEIAEPMLDELLEAHSDYLPQFD